MLRDTMAIDALLIEDSYTDARLVKSIIKASDCETSRLCHVELFKEALILLESDTFDVVLLDLHLPDGEGLELIKQLKQLAPHTPVVIMTGLQDPRMAELAIQEGAQDYVIKSDEFSPSKLAKLGLGDVGNLLVQRLRYAIKRAEARQRLVNEQERYSLVAQKANNGIWDWDLNTNCVYYSPTWNSLLGLSPQDTGSSEEKWLSRIHPHDRGMFQQRLKNYLTRQRKQFHCEYRIRHENNDYLWVLVTGSAIRDEDGKALRIIGTQTDMTIRTQLALAPPQKADLPQKTLHTISIGLIASLADLYIEEKRLAEALPLVEGTLMMRKWLLGDNHGDVACNVYQLATMYDNLGRYKKAEIFYKEALALFEKILGPEDATTGLIRLKTFVIIRMNQKMGL